VFICTQVSLVLNCSQALGQVFLRLSLRQWFEGWLEWGGNTHPAGDKSIGGLTESSQLKPTENTTVSGLQLSLDDFSYEAANRLNPSPVKVVNLMTKNRDFVGAQCAGPQLVINLMTKNRDFT